MISAIIATLDAPLESFHKQSTLYFPSFSLLLYIELHWPVKQSNGSHRHIVEHMVNETKFPRQRYKYLKN